MDPLSNQSKPSKINRSVYIVDGLRTPFLKSSGKPGLFSASDLAVAAGRNLLARQAFAPTAIDEVIIGCVNPSVDEANVARLIGLRLGCGEATPAYTVQRNCASGMQSLDSGFKDIALGRADLVLAGGTEAMSHAPLLYNSKMVQWFANLSRAKTTSAKFAVMAKLSPSALFAPVIALLHGLTDPLSGLLMGQTAEELAHQFDISREAMDEFAFLSHQRAVQRGPLAEITPLYTKEGTVISTDTGVRADCSLAALAQLKPFFDRKFGRVTAGNSSQVSDGAALLILASEDAVQKYNLPILGKIVDTQWAALNPDVMGLGPVMAATPLLQRHQLNLADVDFWEINEAFAAQVIACERAWQSDSFCKKYLGLDAPFGTLNTDRFNVDGGATAIGHPVGASGARIVLHLLQVMQREKAKRGVAAICIGGGQGGAMLVESV